ncbi:response regulator transcription factor [Glaciecola sp. XM2]|jgi:two-component system response regulator CpxR|uniref:response regulator transcription factor n=1 Tax=Glaciecola sp. XM2 TaxID=1914931 RepID=UPI001BDF1B30|nr:response regulator transcription factor [Glaciecola sp. XM2]MBT1449822.1 response regulator transcription factor [Glaciecola sp. XM2]
MQKLLIIDDDIDLTTLLSEYLSAQQFDVAVANSPDEGIARLKNEKFDVLLLDVMMPVMDGFEALKALRQFSSIPVIMLTARGDDFDKILGLELGADDYLPKPFNHRELLARIKALIRRLDPAGGFTIGKVLSLHNITVDESSRSVKVLNKAIEMTGTEFVMLAQLMKSAGQLLSKEQLSESVLGRKLAPFDRSLDMHVSNIRKKLAQEGVQDVIKTVRGNGYMMVTEQVEQ